MTTNERTRSFHLLSFQAVSKAIRRRYPAKQLEPPRGRSVRSAVKAMSDPDPLNLDPVADADPALALEERRRRIRNLIQERSQVTVTELARQFAVSAVTIRSDLTALDEVGAIVRIHGGALPRRDSDEVPIDVKQTLHRAEKMRIAAAAL